MAKPEYHIEKLANDLFTFLDSRRRQLLAEISALQRDPDDPKLSTPPVYQSVLHGSFMSGRVARDCLDALETRRFANIHDDIEGLRSSQEARQACIQLIAYFLKYRYLDLSDFSPAVDDGVCRRESQRTWDLPPGHEGLGAATGSQAEGMITRRVKAAPWLGALHDHLIREAVCWLVEIGFLEFFLDTDIRANEVPDSGVGVLRVRQALIIDDPAIRKEYERVLESGRLAEDLRRDLVADLGVGIGAVGAYETYQLVQAASDNDTIRIATYHLRTVVGSRTLTQWFKEKPNVRVDIMCLGPTSIEGLTEGADPESLLASLAEGIQNFQEIRRELPRKQRGQIRIRIYGDVEGESFFRGAILSGAKRDGRDPKRILTTIWRFGEYRANYGEILKMEGESNLARIILGYYENAWRNAIPALFSRKIDWVSWMLRSLTLESVTTIIVGGVASLALIARPAWNGDPFFALLGTLPILIATVARIGKQIYRAVTLTRAVRDRQ